MPVVNITIYKGRSAEEKKSICQCIQKIIKDTFKIDHENFHHRINEYDDSNLFIPPVCSKNYIFLEFELMPGRSSEEKKNYITELKPV